MLYLIIILIVIITLFVLRSSTQIKEQFVDVNITHDIKKNEYTLSNSFKEQCMYSIIKPTDVSMTNVIDYFHNRANIDFVGVCKGHRSYMIVSKNSNIKHVKDIPQNVIIGYANERDKLLFHHVLTRVYNKTAHSFEKVTDHTYVNDYCDSLDNTSNIFIDFMMSDKIYFVFSFSSIFDVKLYGYFKDFFMNRLNLLEFGTTNIRNHIFNSRTETNLLKLDELICKNKNHTIDYDKLIYHDYIDFELTQQYLDLYNCDIPQEIREHLPKTNNIMDVRIDDLANTKDSCHEDSLIKTTSSPKHNIYGINVYKSKHCKSPQNNFVDIVFPFTSEYEMTLSPSDFNQLKIKSKTFDDLIPVNNAFKKNFLPRYKINVDPIKYPTDAYIDGIYYGSYGDSDHTILTNSIPFDLDVNKHKIIFENNEVSIHFNDGQDFTAFYSYKNVSISVKLMEGDRVYINPDTIFESPVYNFLNSKLQANVNLFHGYVEKDEHQFVIKLENIRETNRDGFKNIQMKCYNENLEETSSNCEYERPCKYNYECPFFQSNKNYKNNFGGCQMNGFCEMPIGVTKRSLKKFIIDEESKPLCNNCDIGDSDKECCENFSSNSSLNSPDYMFDGDTDERIKQIFMQASSKCDLYINKYF